MATKVTPPWAATGTKTKPSDAKINQGWAAGEQPPYEWENERNNARDTAINDLVDADDRIKSTSIGSDGSSYVGFYQEFSLPEQLATGTVRTALVALLGMANARPRTAEDEPIAGDWRFNGNIQANNAQLGLKDSVHADKRACINQYGFDGDANSGIAHPFTDQAFRTVGTEHTDPCAITDIYGRYYLVLIETDGSVLRKYNFETDTYDTETITGLNIGVLEITSACSDGTDIYVLVRRGASVNDTVAKITASSGAVAWERNLVTADALRGYPYDRIQAGNVTSESPWTVELYIVSGDMTLATTGVFRKMTSDNSVVYDQEYTSLGTKKPTGGLMPAGDLVGVTCDASDGTTATLAVFAALAGTDYSAVAMAASGTSASDYAYDLAFDGRRFCWTNAGGTFRYHQPAVTNKWATVNQVDSTVPFRYNGFSCVFDGTNVWCIGPDSSQQYIDIYRVQTAGNPGTAVQYPDLIRNTAAWDPFATPWPMGRGCRVGPHIVFTCADPASISDRNSFFTIFNSALWTS